MKMNDWKPSVKKLCLIISLVISAAWLASPAKAADSNVIGLDIVYLAPDLIELQISLSQPLVLAPRMQAGQGTYHLDFINLSSAKNFTISGIKNSPLRKAQLRPSPTGSSLDLEFSDILAFTEDALTFQDKGLKLSLLVKKPTKPKLSGLPLAETGRQSKKLSAVSIYDYIWPILGYLALLLGVAYLLLSYYKKRLLKGKHLKYGAKLVEVFHLSTKQKIWVLNMQQRLFALSVTPQSVSLVAELDSQRKTLLADLAKEKGFSLASIKAAALSAATPAAKASGWVNWNNRQDFKKELTARINQLKPLK